MAKKPTILRTPESLSEALELAERELKRPPSGHVELVKILPAKIKTRPELFQPRGFYTTGSLDADHVRKLARRIQTKGELDPPLVANLLDDWVCIDGHHRIAAYLKSKKWEGPIVCQWFEGTVREAVDESVKRNEVIKLEMRRGDRYEAAWQRVVLGWGSKKQICFTTGVSDGLIAMMRRVVEEHRRKDKAGKAFREKLPAINKSTWTLARATYLNLEEREYDERKEAAKLARALKDRLHRRLSNNKRITAMALAIYDPDLPEPLQSELQKVSFDLAAEDSGNGPRLTSDLMEDLGRLRGAREELEAQIAEVTSQLEERGVETKTLTRSDATWESWVMEGSEVDTGYE